MSFTWPASTNVEADTISAVFIKPP